MTSLTRADARQRAAAISDVSYDVRLDLTTGERYFQSVTEIRFASTGADTFLDVAAHELRSAVLNGRELDLGTAYDAASGRLHLTGLTLANELAVEAQMAYSHDGEGLHRHVDPADGLTYLYAMSFLDAAPRWFACFDQPDLKAPVAMDVLCPADWTVAGNGPATRTAPGRWRIEATGPLATYFTTLLAGPYHQLRDAHEGLSLVLHTRRSLAEHLDREAVDIFAVTKHCLDELHRLFGVRYPWAEYHQAFVPEFNAGAMENPGCVTFRDSLVFRSKATDGERADRAVTIAHEMAHMWFGDLVTMRWWDDLWLNESFAEYLGHRVIGAHTWPAFGIERKSWGYRADRRPSTHPVAGNGARDAAVALSEFDGISYAKGASVLRQLAVHLGDEVFLAGLRRYIGRHAHGNAEFADLVASWRDSGAVGLDDWVEAWLRTTGMDVLSIDGADLLRTATAGTARPHTISIARLENGVTVEAGQLAVTDERTAHGLDAGQGGLLVPDAYDETWAKVALADEVWLRLPGELATVAEPRTRVVLWNALQLAVADAEIDPLAAIDIVAHALPAESDDAILSVVGKWIERSVAGAYLTDPARAAAYSRLCGAMLAVIDVAEPGSGRQLAAARIAIAATGDPARLHEWLEGRALPDGLVIDAELRWLIVRQLAALGDLSESDIDAERAADDSSQGAVHAAGCRAARPDAGAKAAAWQALMQDAERPNYELCAIAGGFWQPGQQSLTAPYVERYFPEIGATATFRSGMIVDRVATLAYPWTAVADGTLAATERLLADDGLPAGIRRAVVDAGDDLRRALVARKRFGR